MFLNCLIPLSLICILLLIDQHTSGQTVNCPDRTGRWPDSTQCDAYLECVEGIGENKLCPDGLVFSPERYHYSYPCVFPQEADCTSRPNLQPAQPTEDCPHQFGMYKYGDVNNCGQFMTCSNGIAYIQDCPVGLAFNERILRCDWPDLVDTCNAEGYLGFSCPPDTPDPYYGPAGGYSYYRSPAACDRYFICLSGRPRLFICGAGNFFDTETNTCLPEQNVTSCYNGGASQNLQAYQTNSYNTFSNNQYFG